MSCAYQYGVETTPQPRGDSEGERARCDLLAPLVRRDEDVGRGEQVGDLLDRQEAVVELDVILEAEVEHRLLESEAVTLSLAVRHVGVRSSGDDVHHLGMALDDRGQRLDHRLDPLAGRDQPEGREHEPVLAVVVRRSSFERVRIGAPCEHRRRSVRDDPNLARRARLARHEQSLRGLRHHDHELGLAAERREHVSLMGRRLREHGVQRDDEGLRELLDEREDVGAVGAAEDPVLVLEQNDVDVQPAEDPRRADVVASNRLCDRGDEPRSLRAGRVVDDDDLLDTVDPVDAEQRCRARRPQRCRSRTHAAGRWRRSRCARLTAPFRRDSGAAPRRQRSRFAVSVADVRRQACPGRLDRLPGSVLRSLGAFGPRRLRLCTLPRRPPHGLSAAGGSFGLPCPVR